MPDLEITVYGRPAPQGSKRHVGGGRMIEMSPHVKAWREAVSAAAAQELMCATVPLATADAYEPGPKLPRLGRITGPVELVVTFSIARPKAHYRTGKFAGLLKPGAPAWPAVAPDLSKLVRATEDALTNAGVWADDALVVRTVSAKVYIGAGQPDALHRSGAVIRVRPLGVV